MLSVGALVVTVIIDLIVGDMWWLLYVEVALWIGLAYQFGWTMPASVDRWRAEHDRISRPH